MVNKSGSYNTKLPTPMRSSHTKKSKELPLEGNKRNYSVGNSCPACGKRSMEKYNDLDMTKIFLKCKNCPYSNERNL